MAGVDREHLAWASVFVEADDSGRYEVFRSAMRYVRLLDLRHSHRQQQDFLLSQRTGLIEDARWVEIGTSSGTISHSLWPLSIWLPLPVAEFYFQAAFLGQATVGLDSTQSNLEYELFLYRPDGISSEECEALRSKQVISQWSAFKCSRVVRICIPVDSIEAIACYRLNHQSLGMLCLEVGQSPSFEWQFVFESRGIGPSRDRDDFTPENVASRCGRHYIFSDAEPLIDFVKTLLSSRERMRQRQQRIRLKTTNLHKEIPHSDSDTASRGQGHVDASEGKDGKKEASGLKRKLSGKQLNRMQSVMALQRWQKISQPVVSGKFRVSHRRSKQNLVSPENTPRQEIIAVLVKHGLVNPELHTAAPKDASEAEQLPFVHNNFLGNELLVKSFNPCFVDYLNFTCEAASELDAILEKAYRLSDDSDCVENGIVTAAKVLSDETENIKELEYYFSLCARVALPCKEYKHCLRCHKCVSWRYWHCYACETCTKGQTSIECENCSSRRRVAAEGSDAELLTRYASDKPDWNMFTLTEKA